MNQANPIPDSLLDLLKYDPLTGQLAYRVSTGNKPANSLAGTVYRGRVRINHNRKGYYAHRIIWRIVTGTDAPEFIDHIDGNPLNNRFENLRAATIQENNQNRRRRDGKLAGVYFDGHSWRARAKRNGKSYSVTGFATAEEAHEKYKEMKNALAADLSPYML